MLIKLFPSLENNKLITLLNKFLYSYYYVAFMALLTCLTSLFGFEIYTYYLYVLFGGLLPCLFCKDMTPVFAPLGMAYSSVSLISNNSVKGKSLFGGRWYHLYILLALIVLVIGARFIFELVTNKEKRHYKPYLLIGYVVFGLSCMTAGLGSPYYNMKEFTFGLVELLALSGCYFLLIYLIDWKNLRKDYFAWLMMLYGLCLVVEVFTLKIINQGGAIRTGWGVNNNVAGQLCLCLGGPIYLAIKNKWAPIYLAIEGFMILAIGFTNSRDGALMGVIICLGSLVIYFIKTNKRKRIEMIALGALASVLFVVFAFIFTDTFVLLFPKLSGYQGDPVSLHGRNKIWQNAYENFIANPAFGLGWYQCKMGRSDYFSYGFIPGRYHNTFFQVLGSLGIFGLVAFAIHRYQTIKMTFKNPSLEKTFIFICILGLLLTSLFDCHFFNLGPGLNYCILLAMIEGENIRRKEETTE